MPDTSIHEPAPQAKRDFLADLQGALGSLRRGWRLVAVSLLVCLSLAALYLASARRKYQASARLLVLQQGGRPLSVANTDPNRIMDGVEDYIPTHSQLISSPLVVKQAIASVGLDKLPMLAAASRKNEDPVDTAIDHLKVTRPDRLAKILKVDYRAWSPAEATGTLAAIVDSYNGFVRETFQKKSNEVAELISRARDKVGKELDELEGEYVEFRRKSPVLSLDESGRSLASRRLEQWDRAVNEAELKAVTLTAQLELGRRLCREGTGLWSVAHALGQVGGESNSLTATLNAGTSLSGTSDYIRQLTQERQQLAERFGPDYARVHELQEQVSRAQARARVARGRLEHDDVKDLLTALERSLDTVVAMRVTLARRFNDQQERAKADEITTLADSTLRGKLERQRALFNTVVDQLKQAQYASDFNAVISQTVQEPVALPWPVRPMVLLVLSLAATLGLGLGAGAAVLADRLERRIRSPAELREVLGFAVLGQIPRVAPGRGGAAAEFGLVCHAEPRSLTAESFRAVRTNLDYLRRRQNVRVILVTSPGQSDGKSSSASNLAISMAQAGRKVLLVDADLRRPTQHRIHGLSRETGLVCVIRDASPLVLAASPSEVPNLDVVGSGPEVANPAELLASPRLAEALAEARESYDMVVVDSPPMLAVADAAIIAEAVDGVVFVVPSDGMRLNDALRVREILNGLGTPVLGTLANRVGSGAGAYTYGYTNGDPGAGAAAAKAERRPAGPHWHGDRGAAPADHNGRAEDLGTAAE